MGSVVEIKLTEQPLQLKIYHLGDIPYSQSYSISEWLKNIFYYTETELRTPVTIQKQACCARGEELIYIAPFFIIF